MATAVSDQGARRSDCRRVWSGRYADRSLHDAAEPVAQYRSTFLLGDLPQSSVCSAGSPGDRVVLSQRKERQDRAFRWMWLTIVLSFGFYIPVVLWADTIPMIGMLMIPKTCAYVWTVLIGYFAMKKECR